MSTIIRNEALRLARHAQAPCISIYTPMAKLRSDIQQNPVRFRNLLKQAEEKLNRRSAGRAMVDELLAPASALLEDDSYWAQQEAGLVLFSAPGLFLDVKCPCEVSERVIVGSRFHLKPLLPLLVEDETFYILAISRKTPRLLRASRYSVQEEELPEGVPAGIEKLANVYEHEKQLQYHGYPHQGPGGTAVFHGHGSGQETNDDILRQYLRQIDEGLHDLLHRAQTPLVLACVEEYFPIYQSITSYDRVAPEFIAGNQDRTSAQELRERGWAIVSPSVQDRRVAAMNRYLEARASGQAIAELEAVIPAAADGRVDTLFVASDREVPGAYDPQTRIVLREGEDSESEDLTDLAAHLTLLGAGLVYPMASHQLPEPGLVNALLRY